MLDGSAIRARAHAAGARRQRGKQALGRSKGGFPTLDSAAVEHLRADARGRPVTSHLTGGERHDPRPRRGRAALGRRSSKACCIPAGEHGRAGSPGP
jgi:hypothetical protein